MNHSTMADWSLFGWTQNSYMRELSRSKVCHLFLFNVVVETRKEHGVFVSQPIGRFRTLGPSF